MSAFRTLHLTSSLIGAVALLAASVIPVSAQDRRCEHGFAGLRLPRLTRGPAIPGALGARVAEVAEAYGQTDPQLRALCQRDKASLHSDVDGRLLYVCSGLLPLKNAATAAAASTVTAPSYPLSETFFLSSNLNASKIIYLDFTGHTTSGTAWNTNFTGGASIVTPAYDTDGNPAAFSDAELANIQQIWKRVAEDYAPFNVNVTTREPDTLDELRKSSSTDIFYGIRVVIGGSSTSWFGSAGGVAYLTSFNWSSDTPAFVFPAQLGNGYPKYVAEAASHEAGHTFGLSHDGSSTVEYYEGHADWAPIMGVGYYKNTVQWSKGEYTAANNTEDDNAIISREVAYRTDAHGNTLATATAISGPAISADGVIEQVADKDLFKITTGTGSATFTAKPDNISPNLDIQLRLLDSTGAVLFTANDVPGMGATLSASLPQGTYYLEVDGVGTGAATTAYNDYGSLGQFTLTGTAPSVTGQPPVAVADSSTPLTGTAPLTVNFSSAGSQDPDGIINRYSWNFGNGTTFEGQSAAYTYTTPGTYTATLTVYDNTGLTGTDTVTVVVSAPPVTAKTVAVSGIAMSLTRTTRGYAANATVTIKDQSGKVVPNATVTGKWTGLATGTYSGKTNRNGVLTFTSPVSRNRGTFTFTVTGVKATGFTYDATKNTETTDSIATP